MKRRSLFTTKLWCAYDYCESGCQIQCRYLDNPENLTYNSFKAKREIPKPAVSLPTSVLESIMRFIPNDPSPIVDQENLTSVLDDNLIQTAIRSRLNEFYS